MELKYYGNVYVYSVKKKKLILILLKSIYTLIIDYNYRLTFEFTCSSLIIEKVIEISRSVQPEQRKYSFAFY